MVAFFTATAVPTIAAATPAGLPDLSSLHGAHTTIAAYPSALALLKCAALSVRRLHRGIYLG